MNPGIVFFNLLFTTVICSLPHDGSFVCGNWTKQAGFNKSLLGTIGFVANSKLSVGFSHSKFHSSPGCDMSEKRALREKLSEREGEVERHNEKIVRRARWGESACEGAQRTEINMMPGLL